MSTSSEPGRHRGFVVPEVELENGIWYIADENVGWFSGRNAELVTDLWRLKVDFLVTQSFVEEGLFVQRGDEEFMCTGCGSLVLDVFLHRKFHGRVDN